MSNNNIQSLIDEADALSEEGHYEQALASLRRAVALIPEPFEEQPESAEVIAAIGDNYFWQGEYEKAEKAFTDIMHLNDSPANPYVRLRRGQIAHELGNTGKAKSELACAYMNGGLEIFDNEDPKYLDFIEPIINQAKMQGLTKH